MIRNNAVSLAPLILLGAGILIPLAAFKLRRLAWPLAAAASLAAASVSTWNAFWILGQGTVSYRFGGWPPPVGIEYVLDPLSGFMAAVINGIAFLVLLHSKKTVEAEIPEHRQPPYYALAMLFLCGANGIIMTGDFFNLYVFLEIASLSLYGLVAVGEKKSPVAAFRYLIMGTVGGSFYLLGVGFLYISTGSLNMADVGRILGSIGSQPAVMTALAFMVVGLGIKMAVFPLHGWLPDAYTQAASASSAIMAPIGTKVGAYGLLRIPFFVFGVKFISQSLPLVQVLAWVSAAGILYGSVMAIAQDEMKRMLAYSSVAQVGYIGLGLGLANPMGLVGAMLHVLNHGLMKATLFLVAGNFRLKLGHSRISVFDESVRRRMPWTAAAFTVGALAMIGVPPTAGFFSKWYLALGAVEKRSWIFLGVILLSSLLNAVYFFRVLERLYLKPADRKEGETGEIPAAPGGEARGLLLVPTLVLAAALVVVGLLNAIIVEGILLKALPPGF